MIRLYLNKELYSSGLIHKAIDAYTAIANISLRGKDDYWVVEFKRCMYDVDLTACEFENYVIGLEATRGVAHEDL